MKTLASLILVAALAACAPSTDKPCHHGHSAPAATKEKAPCHCKKGFCPHAMHGEGKHGQKKPCHGGMHKDYDVKHDAEWHNAHSH